MEKFSLLAGWQDAAKSVNGNVLENSHGLLAKYVLSREKEKKWVTSWYFASWRWLLLSDSRLRRIVGQTDREMDNEVNFQGANKKKRERERESFL